MEIIVEPKPKRMGMAKEEARLQSQCVIEFVNRFPERRKFLIGTFQEVKSPVEGLQKRSLGLVRGVADLLYVEDGVLTGIEMKFPNTQHSVQHLKEQCEWLMSVPRRGYFCDSVACFWNIIEGRGGIEPKKVLERLKIASGKNILWQSDFFR